MFTIKWFVDLCKDLSVFLLGLQTQRRLDEAMNAAKARMNGLAVEGQALAQDAAQRLRDTAAGVKLPELSQWKPAFIDKEELEMKKSTFAAILAFLAMAVGALTAYALYLRKREKELNEYEQLLFDGDWEDEAEEAASEKEEEYILSVEEEPEAEA